MLTTQAIAITESLRAATASDPPPHWGEKKATITQCGAALLWSLAGQSSHSQRPIKPIICRIICEIKTLATSNQAIVKCIKCEIGPTMTAGQWCTLFQNYIQSLILSILCYSSSAWIRFIFMHMSSRPIKIMELSLINIQLTGHALGMES